MRSYYRSKAVSRTALAIQQENQLCTREMHVTLQRLNIAGCVQALFKMAEEAEVEMLTKLEKIKDIR